MPNPRQPYVNFQANGPQAHAAQAAPHRGLPFRPAGKAFAAIDTQLRATQQISSSIDVLQEEIKTGGGTATALNAFKDEFAGFRSEFGADGSVTRGLVGISAAISNGKTRGGEGDSKLEVVLGDLAGAIRALQLSLGGDASADTTVPDELLDHAFDENGSVRGTSHGKWFGRAGFRNLEELAAAPPGAFIDQMVEYAESRPQREFGPTLLARIHERAKERTSV